MSNFTLDYKLVNRLAIIYRLMTQSKSIYLLSLLLIIGYWTLEHPIRWLIINLLTDILLPTSAHAITLADGSTTIGKGVGQASQLHL